MIYLRVNFGYLVITRGKKHSFLGMNIEITKEKKIQIALKEHLEEVLETFGEEISSRLSLLAQHNIFTMNDESETLYE